MNQYQNITLVLADGRRIKAVARAFCSEQEIEMIRVVDIEITDPSPLPLGYEFEVVLSGIAQKAP